MCLPSPLFLFVSRVASRRPTEKHNFCSSHAYACFKLRLDLRQTILPKSFSFLHSSSSDSSSSSDDSLGRNAWSDRIEAEKSVEAWLAEYPSTFITITGPPGSGKTSLVSRVLKKQNKYVSNKFGLCFARYLSAKTLARRTRRRLGGTRGFSLLFE